MVSKYVVRDIMSRGIFEISLDTSISEAAKIMGDNNISSLVVSDDDGIYWGILTSTDILKHYTENLDELKAKDIMVSKLITVEPLAPLEKAAAIMAEHKIHHLYVLSELREDKIIGIISSNDLIKALQNR